MKLHLAAALALVGWCLIVPPESDIHAPLSRWDKLCDYTTEKECESAKAFSIYVFNDPARLGPDAVAKIREIGAARAAGFRQRVLASKCVAGEDFRLKDDSK